MDLELGLDGMVAGMEARKETVLDVVRRLKTFSNRRDHYWKHILDLAKEDYFFETWMIQNWIGQQLAPRSVLEIGTRAGGSLANLLISHPDPASVNIVLFDIFDTGPRVPGDEVGSPDKVRSNLNRLGLPDLDIEFNVGDSRETVPAWLAAHPEATFDYVLVDGAHDKETALIDLRNIAEAVAPGGVLVFDDLISYDLQTVWKEFMDEQGDRFRHYEVMHRKGMAWAFRASGVE